MNYKQESKITYWLLGLSIILFGTSLYLNVSHTVVSKESIVLTFVGILATFIVVGNFAQIIEIRNHTNNQIRDYEIKTQAKLKQFDDLNEKVKEATDKLQDIEMRTYINSAQASRIYGNITLEKGKHVLAVKHYTNAIQYYNNTGKHADTINTLLKMMLTALGSNEWYQDKKTREFNYQKRLDVLKQLSDDFHLKREVIDRLTELEAEENDETV